MADAERLNVRQTTQTRLAGALFDTLHVAEQFILRALQLLDDLLVPIERPRNIDLISRLY